MIKDENYFIPFEQLASIQILSSQNFVRAISSDKFVESIKVKGENSFIPFQTISIQSYFVQLKCRSVHRKW